MSLNIKKNIVRADIFDYNIGIFGSNGVGKSTLAFNVCQKLLGQNYVIFNCGKEDGIKALNGAIYLDVPTYEDFRDAIDEIVDERTTTYKDLRCIVIDTIDEVYTMAEDYAVRKYNRENPSKKATSVNGILGGYGAGLTFVENAVLGDLWKLKSVGISFFIIGHTKDRTIQDNMNNGQEYDIVTSSLSNRYFTGLANKLDVIGICYIDRTFIQQKTAAKDIHGKAIEKSRIASEARKIVFRSDDYVTTSKSRFPDIANECELNADAFIKTIEDAIDSLIKESGKSKEEIVKEQTEEKKEQFEEVVAQKAEEDESKQLDSIRAQIKDFCVANKTTNKEAIMKLMSAAKEMNLKNPLEVSNLDDAKKLLALCA